MQLWFLSLMLSWVCIWRAFQELSVDTNVKAMNICSQFVEFIWTTHLMNKCIFPIPDLCNLPTYETDLILCLLGYIGCMSRLCWAFYLNQHLLIGQSVLLNFVGTFHIRYFIVLPFYVLGILSFDCLTWKYNAE